MQKPDDAIADQDASIEICADPIAVDELVSDIARMGEWSPECEEARADPGVDFTFVVGGVEANCTKGPDPTRR